LASQARPIGLVQQASCSVKAMECAAAAADVEQSASQINDAA
jgi:hypothetical protein